jgi:adenosylhomocysteine nucleosidase
MYQSPILVCFAVKEEAGFFQAPASIGNCQKLITGMGRKNADRAIRKFLSTIKPRLLITAGFAGGLNPELAAGTVVFDVDQELEASLGAKLLKAGAMPAKFHCAECVAVTAAEKQVLWQLTGADVVEMESAIIRAICRENKIPSATVRVISDAAGEDLPLDFNVLMTADDRINYLKLTWRLITDPQKIPGLLRFQKQTSFAARQLAEKLRESLLP